jgi:hypothetical protein
MGNENLQCASDACIVTTTGRSGYKKTSSQIRLCSEKGTPSMTSKLVGYRDMIAMITFLSILQEAEGILPTEVGRCVCR